jgi:hypothetical protein
MAHDGLPARLVVPVEEAMRKVLVLLVALLAVLAGTSSPAAAITGNYVEDFEHRRCS